MKPTPIAASFTQRVRTFWSALHAAAPSLREQLADAARQREVVARLQELAEGLCPGGCAWGLGLSDDRRTWTFTLAPEGDLDRLLLFRHWLDLAPSIAGFAFAVGTAPGPHGSLELDGERFAEEDVEVAFDFDRERRKIDLGVYHGAFGKLEPGARMRATFLLLDHALGEDFLEVWCGTIDPLAGRPPGALPLPDLRARLVEELRDAGLDPELRRDQWYTSYGVPEPEASPSFPRADLVGGTSLHPQLVAEYLEAKGEPPDRLQGTGAAYAWLALPTANFELAQLVDQRSEIEDRLSAKLTTARVLGGSYGTQEVGIDLLLFDPEVATRELQMLLRDESRGVGARLCFFAGGRPPIDLRR